METNLNNVLIFGLVYLLLPGLLVGRALHFPKPAQLAAWASTYDLQLTPENQPVVSAYLRRTRRFRALPTALAWTTTGLPLLTGEPLPFGLSTTAVVLYAYFAGAALAVATTRGDHAPRRTRQARLAPRAVDDYLATSVRRLLWGCSALVLALVPVYAAVATWARHHGPTAVAPVGELAGAAAVALAIALISEVAQRRLVARSQPVTSLDLIAADDALRSASVAAAAGAGLVVVLSAFASQVEAITRLMQTDWLRWPLHILALGAVFLALVSFFSAFRPEAWWLGRRHAPSSAA
jgi:hypothetical protein